MKVSRYEEQFSARQRKRDWQGVAGSQQQVGVKGKYDGVAHLDDAGGNGLFSHCRLA
jgi:hypothetical protein